MQVLVTGAAGFFGLALTRAFARVGHDVLAADSSLPIDFQPRPGTPLDRVRYVTIDISDRASLSVIREQDVDGVVHAAAVTPTIQQQYEEPERIVDVNLGGTINLLAAARQAPHCRKFLHVSSAGVFDQSKDAILRENDANGGDSLYGAAKIASEHIVRRYGHIFNLQVASVRPTSLYGPGERPRPSRPNATAVYQLVTAASRGQRVHIQGRDARCDWLYVDDAADAVCQLVTSDRMTGQVFNLSSGRSRPFSEIVDVVAATLPLQINNRAEWVIDGSPDRPATIVNDDIRDVLAWEPQDVSTGIQRYVASLTDAAVAPFMDSGERPQ